MKTVRVYDVEANMIDEYCNALDTTEAEVIEALLEMVTLDELKDYLGVD